MHGGRGKQTLHRVSVLHCVQRKHSVETLYVPGPLKDHKEFADNVINHVCRKDYIRSSTYNIN